MSETQALFQYAVDGLAEWDNDALIHLSEEQLETVISEAGRIERAAIKERDLRKGR